MPRCREAVVDHVEDGAFEAFGGEGEHAEDAEAEVGVTEEYAMSFFISPPGPGDESRRR